MLTNCPNCGAIITRNTCEYCGTRFSEESNIEILYADDAEIFRVIRDQAKKYRTKKQKRRRNQMTDKFEVCKNFFNDLSKELESSYVIVGSCNQDSSVYLVPKGTEDHITYYSKPAKSFRISDHWNWYANTNKCSNPNYIQCLSVDAPWAFKRDIPGKATKPRMLCQVAVIGNDGKYHAVFGEVFDRKTKRWSWLSSNPTYVAKEVLE